jgi:hypothetical protein
MADCALSSIFSELKVIVDVAELKSIARQLNSNLDSKKPLNMQCHTWQMKSQCHHVSPVHDSPPVDVDTSVERLKSLIPEVCAPPSEFMAMMMKMLETQNSMLDEIKGIKLFAHGLSEPPTPQGKRPR